MLIDILAQLFPPYESLDFVVDLETELLIFPSQWSQKGSLLVIFDTDRDTDGAPPSAEFGVQVTFFWSGVRVRMPSFFL